MIEEPEVRCPYCGEWYDPGEMTVLNREHMCIYCKDEMLFEERKKGW